MTGNTGKHAAVNGLEMYYEIHGEGEPLILLHGGVGAIEMFGEVLPLLAEGRRVITLLQRRAEARRLARLAHQAGRASRSGLRLVSGSRGDGGACVDRCRDADSVRTSHAVAFFELLGGGKQDAGWDGSGMSDARLAILPGTTHYGIFSSSGCRRHAVPGHARAIKLAGRESQER
jgi:hypothetical protein